jgi:hypothetical protein
VAPYSGGHDQSEGDAGKGAYLAITARIRLEHFGLFGYLHEDGGIPYVVVLFHVEELRRLLDLTSRYGLSICIAPDELLVVLFKGVFEPVHDLLEEFFLGDLDAALSFVSREQSVDRARLAVGKGVDDG